MYRSSREFKTITLKLRCVCFVSTIFFVIQLIKSWVSGVAEGEVINASKPKSCFTHPNTQNPTQKLQKNRNTSTFILPQLRYRTHDYRDKPRGNVQDVPVFFFFFMFLKTKLKRYYFLNYYFFNNIFLYFLSYFKINIYNKVNLFFYTVFKKQKLIVPLFIF